MPLSFACSARYLLSALCLTAVTHVSAENIEQRQCAGTRFFSAKEYAVQEELRAKQVAEKSQEEKLSPSHEQALIAKGPYSTSHLGAFHHAQKVDVFGGEITLEDYSLWYVSSADSYKMANWFTSDNLIICPNPPFSFYKYRLVNQDTLVSVDVNLVLSPLIGGFATYYVMAIDALFDQVWLSDGSTWDMTPFDSAILKTWLPGDIVIIGVNDDYLHDLRPNILINANVMYTNYARGICTNM